MSQRAIMECADRSAEPAPVAYALPATATDESLRAALTASFGLREHDPVSGAITYFDTFDARLWRAGRRLWTSREGKRPRVWLSGAGGSLWVDAKEVGFAADLPASPLSEGLAKITRKRRLLPQVEVERERRGVDVLDERHKTVARLSLESGRARVGAGPWRELPRSVELERIRGYDDEHERVRHILVDGIGARELENGTLDLATAATGYAGIVDRSKPALSLAPDASVQVGLRQVAGWLLEIVLANQPGVVDDLDSEFLHDYRVAVRRARSLLGQLRRHFDPAEIEPLREDLSWLGSVTGPVRDLDVFLEHLEDEPLDASRLEPLVAALRKKRRRERRRLVAALSDERHDRLIERWRSFATAVVEGESPSLRTSLAERIIHRFGRMSARVRKALARDDEELLHRARIDGKKLRYLLDCGSHLFPADQVRDAIAALKGIQDELGDLQDTVVQRDMIESFASDLAERRPVPHLTLLEMGGLLERVRRRGAKARRKFEQRWAEFDAASSERRFAALASAQ